MHCDWAGGVRHDLKWLVGLAERLTVESTAGGSRCVQIQLFDPYPEEFQFLRLGLNEVPESHRHLHEGLKLFHLQETSRADRRISRFRFRPQKFLNPFYV